MSATPSAFCCPACGFLIHNRAYPKCERCKADLPAQLLLSKEEVDKGWNAMMADRAKARQKDGGGSHSDGSSSAWFIEPSLGDWGD